jgi:hypothetical protein
MKLMLLSRQGCCLCEGLAERLTGLEPAPQVQLVDVDADPALQSRYGLEVPVLAVAVAPGAGPTTATSQVQGAWHELPRVPPRLSGDGLAVWLQKNGFPGQHT